MAGAMDFSDLLQQGYVEVRRVYPAGEEALHVCFGCSPTNPIGMKMRFFGKPGEPEVMTRYIVHKDYCGFPAFAHGGIIALMFDEVLAYASYHVHHKFGMTKTLNIQFLRPVAIDKEHFIRARVTDSKERPNGMIDVSIEASIHEGSTASGRTCDTATSIYTVLTADKVSGILAGSRKA